MSKMNTKNRPNSGFGERAQDLIHVEDFDESVDTIFVQKHLNPYLHDLFKDLLMRSTKDDVIDKVTFIEYTKLPGIINDRLHIMFSS